MGEVTTEELEAKYTRLFEALRDFEGVDVFKVTESGNEVLVRYDGPALPQYVFVDINSKRLLPKGTGLRLHKQTGLQP